MTLPESHIKPLLKESHMVVLIYVLDGGNKILVNKRKKCGRLAIAVSGTVKKGELPIETAMREFFEELSINLPLSRFVSSNYKMETVTPSGKPTVLKPYSVFLHGPEINSIKLKKNELEKVWWTSLEEALKISTYQEQTVILSQMFEHLENPHTEPIEERINPTTKAIIKKPDEAKPQFIIDITKNRFLINDEEPNIGGEALLFILMMALRYELGEYIHFDCRIKKSKAKNIRKELSRSITKENIKFLVQTARGVGYRLCAGSHIKIKGKPRSIRPIFKDDIDNIEISEGNKRVKTDDNWK